MLILFLVTFSAYIFLSSASLVSEKSGIANISIEGNAIIGVAFYVLFYQYFSSGSNELRDFMTPLISLILSTICTTVFSIVFALLTTKLMTDQIISGSAINLLAPALATFILFMSTGKSSSWTLPSQSAITAHEWFYPILYFILAILLAITLYWLFKYSKTGLRIKASGGNPYALETSGVSVNGLRFKALILSGALSGIGASIWAFYIPGARFDSTVYGIGYIAIGIVIFGQWSVLGICLGSAVIALISSAIPSLINLTIFSNEYMTALLKSLPYITPIVILIFLKSNTMPAKVGKAFKKDQR